MPDDFFVEYIDECKKFNYKGEERKDIIITRKDPFSENIVKISKTRNLRVSGVDVIVNIEPKKNCKFCNYKDETPDKKIYHKSGAITFPNLFPWEFMQFVTAYPPFNDGFHKVLLSQLDFRDLHMHIETEFEIAELIFREYKNNQNIIGMTDFTNWGPYAGASQQHPHSQRQSISYDLPPNLKTEIETCKKLFHEYNENPFDIYIKKELEDGRRVIFNDDKIYIGAPFAPKKDNEIIIIPKIQFSNILQTNENDREFIKSALGVFPALRCCLGVNDLNIVVHMSDFFDMTEKSKFYRWHMHIYPRKSQAISEIGGAEEGYNIRIISIFPEYTAEIIREWYKNPNESIIHEKLKNEFRNHINKQ